MIEAGYPDMVSSSWQGMFVPVGTARPVVMRLHGDILKTLDTQDLKQRFAAGGAQVAKSQSPEEFAEFVAAEGARWGKLAKDAGATID